MKDYKSIHELLMDTVRSRPNQTAWKWFIDEENLVSVSWKDFYELVRKVSKSLIALDVQKDDKVNIISNTCYRWVVSDLGITSIGAVTVGIYQSNLPNDCKYIINHSDAVVIFAENMLQLKKLLEIRNEIPNIRKVVLFNDSYPEDDWVVTFDDFLELGKDVSDEELDKRIGSLQPDDLAGIVYTSGTTGVPKGAMLTHDNITFTAQSVKECGQFREGDTMFLFLPLAHVFARTCTYSAIIVGTTTVFARGMDTLIDDFKVAKPDWFVSVPRIFEKVYSKVKSTVESKGGVALKIFNWAFSVGDEVVERRMQNKSPSFFTGIKYKIAHKLVFHKLHDALGGRVRWCISGAAPLNPEIAKFFHSAGIQVLEGIGMTENTSFTNVNRYGKCRIGTVGAPGPGIEQKIADDGEILFRGRNVMKGYYKMPEETAETIDKDGWLLTGDLGQIDEDGFLSVTGRKKELIITAGGKNIAPAPIEGVIATSKYVNQVCVIGDQKKYLSALITLDLENIQEYADQHGISYQKPEDLVFDKEVYKLIEKEVIEKNKAFASYESIKKITIVPEFTIENGLLTPTMKLKKNKAFEKFNTEIESMYPTE